MDSRMLVGMLAVACACSSLLQLSRPLGWLFVAAQASRGKECHFNVHFAQKVVCSKPDPHSVIRSVDEPAFPRRAPPSRGP